MRNPSILIGMGSGREGWLTIELDSIRFTLEIENGRKSEESLSIPDLKSRLPFIADLAADVLRQAIRVNPE